LDVILLGKAIHHNLMAQLIMFFGTMVSDSLTELLRIFEIKNEELRR
jgi:hypothetical protein